MKMNSINHTVRVGLIAAAFGWTATALAQTAPASPPASQPAVPPVTGATLDDLLGLDKPTKPAEGNAAAGAEAAAAAEHDKQLKDKLNEAQVADAFEQAIEKMSLSARLLDTQFDPGTGTQRVQEDIIAKLNQLLDQAKKGKSKSKKSSSSSQQQNPNPSNPNPSQKQQNAKPQNPGDKRNDKPQDSQEGDPPPLQQGDVNTVIDETRSEWGALPQRVREMLMQGRRDKFSSLYQQLTQEYYKRLAEEGTP